MAMKHCLVCGREYPDTDGACPFCGEPDAARKTPARGGKRVARFSKQFRLIAGTQVFLILVMGGTLTYLLRDISHSADAAEVPSAPVIMLNDPVSPTPEVSEEPQAPQPETTTPDDQAQPPQTDESPSDAHNEQPSETPAVPAKEETPVSDSGAADQLKAGKAVVVNAENGVRVRSGPDAGSKALASFYNGTQITIVRPANDGWYEITFLSSGAKEVTGYMMGDFLENA